MAQFNHVFLMGNLGKDIELRALSTGSTVANFTLAVNTGYFDRSNQWIERTAWVDVKVWGEAGERLSQKVGKGDPVLVEGKLEQDQWVDRATGQNRSKLGIVASKVQVLHRAPRQDGGQPQQRQQPNGQYNQNRQQGGGYRGRQTARSAPPSQQSRQEPPDQNVIPDEDIPF